jgi:hypothetical protein
MDAFDRISASEPDATLVWMKVFISSPIERA